MSTQEQGSEARAAERLIYFSDAVVAIAITLLAIELPVPNGDTMSAFWASVRQNDGHYASFLISFMVIAASWSNHHDVFRYVKRMDARLRTLNMNWLLMIVLIPFATKLLTAKGHDTLDTHALRFGFYALLQVVAAALLLAMVHRIASHQLQEPDTPPRFVADANGWSYRLILGFGLSIPFFFLTAKAWVIWFAIPLLAAHLRRRRRPAASRSGQDLCSVGGDPGW